MELLSLCSSIATVPSKLLCWTPICWKKKISQSTARFTTTWIIFRVRTILPRLLYRINTLSIQVRHSNSRPSDLLIPVNLFRRFKHTSRTLKVTSTSITLWLYWFQKQTLTALDSPASARTLRTSRTQWWNYYGFNRSKSDSLSQWQLMPRTNWKA